MSNRVSRQNFVRQMKSTPLNAEKLQGQSGMAGTNVAAADLNNDGIIAGKDEANALFSQVDRLDSNGDSGSVEVSNRRVQNALSAIGKVGGKPIEADAIRTISAADRAFGEKAGEAGLNSMMTKMNNHRNSIQDTGLGTYFGDHSAYKDADVATRKKWTNQILKSGAAAPNMKESSCIGWAMENVGQAYIQSGKAERWNEIRGIVKKGGLKGTDLAKELQKDGWESVYFNPDGKKSDDGNQEHTYTANQVKKGKPYYGINVDHSAVGYRPTENGVNTTKKNTKGLEKLDEVPFWFGIARGGSHTFVGRGRTVNEFHWDANPDNPKAIEETALNNFAWNSGVIMVPPGSWTKPPAKDLGNQIENLRAQPIRRR